MQSAYYPWSAVCLQSAFNLSVHFTPRLVCSLQPAFYIDWSWKTTKVILIIDHFKYSWVLCYSCIAMTHKYTILSEATTTVILCLNIVLIKLATGLNHVTHDLTVKCYLHDLFLLINYLTCCVSTHSWLPLIYYSSCFQPRIHRWRHNYQHILGSVSQKRHHC